MNFHSWYIAQLVVFEIVYVANKSLVDYEQPCTYLLSFNRYSSQVRPSYNAEGFLSIAKGFLKSYNIDCSTIPISYICQSSKSFASAPSFYLPVQGCPERTTGVAGYFHKLPADQSVIVDLLLYRCCALMNSTRQ